MVALVLALVAAVTLAACGGGGGDATNVLNQTFSSSNKVRSGKLDLSLGIKLNGSPQLQRPVSLSLTGPFQGRGPRQVPLFDFTLALATGAQNLSGGAVSTGDKGFLRFQGQAYQMPAPLFARFQQTFQNSKQLQQPKGRPTLSTLGIDPRHWVKDAKDQGDADVEGTKTTHVSAKIDLPRLLADANKIVAETARLNPTGTTSGAAGLTPQQRQTIQSTVKDARFDLYSGKDDHALRRMLISLSFQVPQGARSRVGGASGGQVTFQLTFANLNQPQTIVAPTNVRPFAELASKLRAVVGGLGGAASGGATGGTAPSGSSNPNAQRYLQCLQSAGGDVAKAQRCAALLNG